MYLFRGGLFYVNQILIANSPGWLQFCLSLESTILAQGYWKTEPEASIMWKQLMGEGVKSKENKPERQKERGSEKKEMESQDGTLSDWP